MKASEVITELEGRRDRSAWDRGVTSYAVGMLEELGPGAELAPGGVREALLNGAEDWPAYSWVYSSIKKSTFRSAGFRHFAGKRRRTSHPSLPISRASAPRPSSCSGR